MLYEELLQEQKRILELMRNAEPGSDEYKNLERDLKELNDVRLKELELDCKLGFEERKVELAEKEFDHKVETDLNNSIEERHPKWYKKIDWTKIATAGLTGAVNVFMITRILRFEDTGVISTKAMNFIDKGKYY